MVGGWHFRTLKSIGGIRAIRETRGTRQFEPVTLIVRELGVLGWIKGPVETGNPTGPFGADRARPFKTHLFASIVSLIHREYHVLPLCCQRFLAVAMTIVSVKF